MQKEHPVLSCKRICNFFNKSIRRRWLRSLTHLQQKFATAGGWLTAPLFFFLAKSPLKLGNHTRVCRIVLRGYGLCMSNLFLLCFWLALLLENSAPSPVMYTLSLEHCTQLVYLNPLR
jgi:hypothetical protein